MKKSPILVLPLLPVIVFLMSSGLLSAADSEASSYPAMYRVAWEEPGKLAAGAMPTGNGDISVNAWVEEDGDLMFYIGKTDSWSEIERLLKVGKVRVRISPNPFKAGLPFRQELRMEEAAIVVQAGAPGAAVNIRIWVDANRPVIRFECTSDQPVEVTASTEIWRTTERDLPPPERTSAWSDRDNPGPLIESPDVLVAGRKTDVLWYHRNASSTWEDSLRLQGLEKLIGEQRDPLRDRTFGALMRGDHFVPSGAGTLKAPAAKQNRLSLHVLTAVTESAEKWEQRIQELAADSDATTVDKAWAEHGAWWRAFWSRSYLIMNGPLVTAASPIIIPVPVPLRLGSGDGGSPFHGKILTARLYGDALTAAEIKSLSGQRTANGPRPEALIAEWDLSKPDADGNYPNQNGGALLAKREGEIGVDAADGTAVFPGPGHLQVAHDPRLDPTEALTLEAWVFAESQPPEGGRIFDKGQGGTTNGYILDTYPGNSLRLISKNGILTAENVLPVGREAHVVATLDGNDGRARLYVDGKLVAERQDSPPGTKIRDAGDIAQTYAMQRFLMAASGRGAFPPKFNGATFNVDYEATGGFNADYRNWGGSYWFQNTRHLHWPNLADGDFDLMKPFFKLYLDTQDLARERTQVWYGHEGVFFPETMSFWGTYANSDYGRNREGLPLGKVVNGSISLHLDGSLEFLAMLLNYYQYTSDASFARKTLLPAAKEILLFWDKHYPRNKNGEIVMDPAQALEAYWDVVNPACDVAGLTYILDGLLALPDSLVDAAQRKKWTELRKAVPPLPMRIADGKEYLAVASEVRKPASGGESPELYSIHPFPLHGVGKPDLERAIRSYWERPNERPGSLGYNTCWSYLSTIAARLGLADEAARLVASRAALFWGSRFFPDSLLNGDWIPDMDNTGSMAFSLQSMLLQTNGDKILLFPAWPKQWDVKFKMHAPGATTVEAEYADGKLKNLVVQPESRRKDVINLLEPTMQPPTK